VTRSPDNLRLDVLHLQLMELVTSGRHPMFRHLDALRNLPADLYTEEVLLPEWRKRRRKQIDDAVSIIRPEPQQHDACRDDVEREGLRVFLALGWLHTKDESKTKEGKQAAGRLAKALRRLEVVLKDENLRMLSVAAVTRHMSVEEIGDAASYCEEVQRARTEPLIRKGAEAKRRAVHCAHALLTKHNKREAGNTAKGNRFCKLAALLYGDPGADLHNQCAAALRKIRKESGAK
jgi:hypothetical protein